MKLILLFAALPLSAHMVSMSTGDLRVDGVKARYELRMPLYEVAHIADAERALFEHIRFDDARLIDHKCVPDATALVCTANFEFTTAPEIVHAEVQLRSGGPATTREDLLSFCRRRLSSYKVPTSLDLVAELNLTLSGKVRHG